MISLLIELFYGLLDLLGRLLTLGPLQELLGGQMTLGTQPLLGLWPVEERLIFTLDSLDPRLQLGYIRLSKELGRLDLECMGDLLHHLEVGLTATGLVARDGVSGTPRRLARSCCRRPLSSRTVFMRAPTFIYGSLYTPGKTLCHQHLSLTGILPEWDAGSKPIW